MITSYGGLERRRVAASALLNKDARSGIVGREPTNREIRAEIVQQFGRELEELGSRGAVRNFEMIIIRNYNFEFVITRLTGIGCNIGHTSNSIEF